MRQLEEQIKKSLIGTIGRREESEEDVKRRLERREEFRERRQAYEKHHSEFLYSIANKKDVNILKLGHGSPSSNRPEEFGRFDAVFLKDDKRIALSTIMPSGPVQDLYVGVNRGDVISSLAASVEAENIDKLYLVLFEEPSDGPAIKNMNETLSLMKESLASKINVIALRYSEIVNWSSNNEL